MKHARRSSALALVVVGAVGLAGCGNGGSSSASKGSSSTAAAPAASSSTGMSMTTSSTTGAATSGGAVSTTSPAADLRVTLDRLLGEHALLATFAMQKGIDGAPDFKPLAGALDRNTADLGAAIGSVYGPQAQQTFLKVWRQHIGFFVDYTVALAKNDTKAQKQALTNLGGYKIAFATFLAKANPNLKADGVAALLQTHINELTTAIRAYHAKAYTRDYNVVREAYAHMFMTGDALAGAIAKQSPAKFGR